MKKSIIAAGAASVALAAMPIVGAMAADFTDTIRVTIAPACTLTRNSTTPHVDGDVVASSATARGTWGTAAAGTADTLSGSMAPGEIDNDYGASNFNVVCNNAGGWKVTAAANPLTGLTTNTESIPVGAIASDTAAWQYTSSSNDSNITNTGTFTTASNIVAQSAVTTPTAGRDFKVQYGVSVDHLLSAQTYEGTIEYTLTQLP
ncbi:hypothetical protein IJG92_01395 [Candidatus Saccharibacteria bacterium]|nr:hypothetical protein [Candidatus Saccharibacteria bacterium]